MAEGDTRMLGEDKAKEVKGGKGAIGHLIELVKVLALPLVTLVVGYWFNTSIDQRQQIETNTRLYAEMMGRREEADSNLRKDMFNSILNTFMSRDRTLSPEQQIRQEILSLELLAHNFHESLDIGPLFKDVNRRIPAATGDGGGKKPSENTTELRGRLEKVAQEVIEHQLTALGDAGMVELGDATPEKIKSGTAYVMYRGSHTVPDPNVKPGDGIARLCLSMATTSGPRHYRQFRLDLLDYDETTREIQVHLYVSQLLTAEECQQSMLDLEGKREVDTFFWVGLFDFPMIDNTRLSNSERCAVSVTALNPSVLSVALVYFPASRASLKDKPYYDEVIRELVRDKPGAVTGTP
ncbi:MAG TPA: hypothetical protein VFV95_16120 [Vicinamibacterales bacterium]|nr:hypothetical protein [Vicinamibacterales bacterium]